jgi:hypothetical protein
MNPIHIFTTHLLDDNRLQHNIRFKYFNKVNRHTISFFTSRLSNDFWFYIKINTYFVVTSSSGPVVPQKLRAYFYNVQNNILYNYLKAEYLKIQLLLRRRRYFSKMVVFWDVTSWSLIPGRHRHVILVPEDPVTSIFYSEENDRKFFETLQSSDYILW